MRWQRLVSVRPAPKGGCGAAARALYRFIRSCLSEARPEGRVRQTGLILRLTVSPRLSEARPEGRVRLHAAGAALENCMVSVRPAPKGGCGTKRLV